MTRQHIRFSALRSIFWGTLLLFLDFDLNFRFGLSFTIPLLPDCLGFWLVGRGTRALAAERPSLGLLAPFWLALGLWSLRQLFPGLSPHIPGALSLLAALVRMYADFQLFTDLAGLAEDLLPGTPLPRQLRSARTAAVLLTTLFYFQDLLLRAPWLTVAAGAAGEDLLPGTPLPRQLRSARTAAVLLTTLFYFQDLLLRAPWLTVAAGAAGFCARVYILLRLWQLSRSMAPAPEASR